MARCPLSVSGPTCFCLHQLFLLQPPLLPSRQIPLKPFSFFKIFDNSCTFAFSCKLSSDFVQFQVTCIWGWRYTEYTFTHGGLDSSQRCCPRWGHRVVSPGAGGHWRAVALGSLRPCPACRGAEKAHRPAGAGSLEKDSTRQCPRG